MSNPVPSAVHGNQLTAVEKFVAQLHSVATSEPASIEAANLLELLLTHSSPPTDLRPLQEHLNECAAEPDSPQGQAQQLRRAADHARSLRPVLASALAVELLLLELAIRLDDSPAERLAYLKRRYEGAGFAFPMLDTPVPRFESTSPSGRVLEDIHRHVRALCEKALLASAAARPFDEWICRDIDVCLLALRMNYCTFGCGVGTEPLGSTELIDDFRECGQPLWNALWEARANAGSRQRECKALADPSWHQDAQARVLLCLAPRAAAASRRDLAGVGCAVPVEDDSENVGALTRIVCRTPIPRSADRCDKEEIERHLVLEQPLPLAPMPTVRHLGGSLARLMDEFPWAGDVLDLIYADLIGRSALGCQVLGMQPTLLVGAPGSGKSRLARRIAQELDVPRLDLPLGGTSDSKVLSGTARGWSSGRPSDLATLMASRRSASAIGILDELDKAIDQHREGGGIQAYLLALFEPETATRHTDIFLKVESDFSGAMWLATANRLSSISPPLVSRMRVLRLDQPRFEHFPVIAENVLNEMANRWGVDRQVLPGLGELDVPLNRLCSARQVRVATEVAVTRWSRELRRH